MTLPVDSGAPGGIAPSYSSTGAVLATGPSFGAAPIAAMAIGAPAYGPSITTTNVASANSPSVTTFSSAIGGFAIGLSPIGG